MSNDDQRTVNVYDRVAGESVDVPGHPKASRSVVPVGDLSEMSDEHIEHEFGDVDRPAAELPVLLSRDFRADPVEGEQGTYVEIIELDDGCPRCGYDRGNHTAHTLAGVHAVVCRACDYVIEQG